jgi:hypothetical protein
MKKTTAQKRYHDAGRGKQCQPAHSALAQGAAISRIELERPAIQNGDGFALLACVAECARFGVALPDWLADRFVHAYESVLNCEVGSWDEAFGGRPYPKGKHLAALRKRREKMHAIWHAVEVARQINPGIPLGASLFEAVGKQLGIGKTLAESYYYESKKSLLQNRDPINRRLKFDK